MSDAQYQTYMYKDPFTKRLKVGRPEDEGDLLSTDNVSSEAHQWRGVDNPSLFTSNSAPLWAKFDSKATAYRNTTIKPKKLTWKDMRRHAKNW